MPQSLVLDCKGEHTYASDLSGVPPGSLALALNVNINRLGICEPRRGYNLLTYSLAPTLRAKKLVFWNSELFAHTGSTFYWYDASTGFTSRGSLTAPTYATTIRYVKGQNKNLYVTSDTGLKMTDAVATSLAAAGIPKGLTIDLAIASAGTGTAVPTHAYVTYQYILAKKDANSNIAYGGVSGRFTIYNSDAGTSNVTATCYLPSGLSTSYFLQLYRTSSTTVSGATGEELKLCYEIPIAASDVSNGYVTVTDIYPDALLGTDLYTNPSQQGILNDNTRPPLARDIAEFKGYLFYADVDQPQRLAFSLISVVSPGLVSTDTIIITQGATVETYTAGAVFNSGTKTFVISTGGTSSQNIDSTIKSFIKCVNLASAIVTAYSMSEADTDLPGKVSIEAKTTGAAAFTVTSARATAFIPNIPLTATVNNTSAADSASNGLAWSKQGQPEAVPLKNIARVGSSDDRIKRIVALRDALLIFKERDGTYVLTGEDEFHFSIKLLDGTAKLLAPDSLAVVNNFAYGLFEAGICEVSPDGGVTVLSIPIKNQLEILNGTPLTALKAYSFGYGSDADGKYILSVPQTSSDTYTTKQHVYDVNGHTFCRWDLALSCGGVNPVDGKMYLGSGDAVTVKIERKAYDYTDAGDFGATCTVSSYSGTTVYINNTSGMSIGDILYQGTTALGYIEAVDAVSGSVTIDDTQAWTLSTADVTHIKAINCKVQWNPDVGGNAAGLKQYVECSIIQKQAFQKSATVYFSSDLNPAESNVPITSSSGNGAFGMFVWGDEVWGGEQAKAPKRVGIPRGHARCCQLSVRFENRVAYSDFQLEGIGLTFNPTSSRTTR